ncbi:MAG: hypothetical protein WAR37_00560 [Candidatus Microsaccharimonas sp.]
MASNPYDRISNSADVALNNPSSNDVLTYNSILGKWTNSPSATSQTNIITPEQFGAVGDGVTDDTVALNAALDAAQTTKAQIQLTRKYRGRINASNKHLHLIGNGSLIQYADGNGVIAVTHGMVNPTSVTSIENNCIVGPITNKDNPSLTITVSAATVAANSLPLFRAEDVWRIDSQDVYPWAGSGTPVGGNVWQAAMFPILGISYQITPSNGGIKENDTVTGATSGASGLVGSYARDANSSTGKMILKWFNNSTPFQNGETILVGGSAVGTISGNGQVLMKGILDDTYTNSPTLRKLRNDLTFIIDGPTIEAFGATDGVVGNANRVSAVSIAGVVNARIRATIADSWKGALLLISCYQADVDVRVTHLPNNATTGSPSSNQPSEQAYGYGVETVGAVERSYFKIHASNCRHAFTTNPNTYGSWNSIATDHSLLRIGIQKDNVVSGVATGCWGAGWDTHEGAMRTHFKNCENISSTGGYRFQSNPNGFLNRAWNTMYTNCRDYGSLVGFRDGTGSYPTTFMTVTRYTNCMSDDFQYLGFSANNPAESANHRFVYINCHARGNGQPANQPYGSAGFEINGVDSELINCSAERFSQAPLQLNSGSSSITNYYLVRDFTASYVESPTNAASGIRISGTDHILALDGISIVQKTSALSMPSSAVRVISGSPTIRWGRSPQTINTSTVVPWLMVSSGSPTNENLPGSAPFTFIGSSAPSLAFTNLLWLDTSGGAGVLKRYDGNSWV